MRLVAIADRLTAHRDVGASKGPERRTDDRPGEGADSNVMGAIVGRSGRGTRAGGCERADGIRPGRLEWPLDPGRLAAKLSSGDEQRDDDQGFHGHEG